MNTKRGELAVLFGDADDGNVGMETAGWVLVDGAVGSDGLMQRE